MYFYMSGKISPIQLELHFFRINLFSTHAGEIRNSEITDGKAQIVVIAPHEAEKVEAYWEREILPYIGIPDPDGRLGKLYGQEWNLIKLGRMPALFIIDQQGFIAFAQYSKNMADIPKNNVMFKIIEGLK